MDFDLNEDQQAILQAVERLLEQHAGPARAIDLAQQDAYDFALHDALITSGFCNVIHDMAEPGTTGKPLAGLEAGLVVEAIARAGGVVSGAAQILVAPHLQEEGLEGPIALCVEKNITEQTPLRFAAQAKHLIMVRPDDVLLFSLEEEDATPVRTSFGYPMGRVQSPTFLEDKISSSKRFGPEKSKELKNWWRLSLAIEAVGTMEGALAHTVDYLKQRRQFGRAIGSFQAIQHRLALCAIEVEGSRWLAREAAYNNAREEEVAAAAAFALSAADLVFSETHQMSGAIGFTREFDLHVWSMRLHALRQELGGVDGHRGALVDTRWGHVA